MKILVYGAGPLGSLFAAQLQQGGHEVSILARGQRLADLREHGIILHDVTTDERTVTRVAVVAQLAPEDAYDLVLVVMRKNHALDILPVLAANHHTPNVLFLLNNAAGPGAWIAALGRERVLIGFPSSAGYREGPVVHVLTGSPEAPWPIPFGEVDGRITGRTRIVARAIAAAPAFEAEIRADMDTWLKYHVALLMPSLAPALYGCAIDRLRMARTRDALVLAVRSIRECFRALRALGLPVTPSKLRFILWLPEPLLVRLLQKLLRNEKMEVAAVKHAGAARDEIRHLAYEFLALARTTPVEFTATDELLRHLEPNAPHLADGQATLPMRWGGMALWGLGLAGLVAGLAYLILGRNLRAPRTTKTER